MKATRVLTYIFTLLLTGVILTTAAQQRLTVAYYDVGRLYDTVASPFYADSRYTPSGKNRWNSERYQRKIKNTVTVIDSLAMPVVVLYGVENEEVVRDIVQHSTLDYNYIHSTIDFYDGLDFALLYFGDRFFIEHTRNNNYWLYVAGEIDGAEIELHLVRRGDRFPTLFTPIQDFTPDATIVCGRLSARDMRHLGINDPLLEAERNGYGDSRGEQGWHFESRIGSDKACDGGVYIAKWLLTNDQSRPRPTFSRTRYEGGYSSHLPLYITIELDNE